MEKAKFLKTKHKNGIVSFKPNKAMQLEIAKTIPQSLIDQCKAAGLDMSMWEAAKKEAH